MRIIAPGCRCPLCGTPLPREPAQQVDIDIGFIAEQIAAALADKALRPDGLAPGWRPPAHAPSSP